MSGIEICELLPHLAKRADKYAILRSLHCSSNDHGIAGTIGLTGADSGATSLSGQILPGLVKPTHGSVVSRVLGFAPAMPRFVTMGGWLHQGKKRITGEGGGTVGSLHDPFRLDYDPESGVKIPQLDLLDGLTADGLSSRRSLKTALDQLARSIDHSPQIERMDKFSQQAYSLLTSPETREVFDLSREPDDAAAALRPVPLRPVLPDGPAAGRSGRRGSCRSTGARTSSRSRTPATAAGTCTTATSSSSRTGTPGCSTSRSRRCSTISTSAACSSETIVVAVGEFGRTPKINGKAGRDHWEHCYSGLVAGGGLKVGQVDRRKRFPRRIPRQPPAHARRPVPHRAPPDRHRHDAADDRRACRCWVR